MKYLRILVAIFRRPYYLILAAIIASFVFSVAVLLPSFQLLWIVSQTASLGELLSLTVSLYGAISSNFTFVSASYTIVIALLFGMNVSLLTFYIQKMRTGIRGLRSTGLTGFGGLISGSLGIGCAACGTFIFTSVLTLFGIGGVLAYLPFGGEEFGFLGVALLLYSIYSLTKKITHPLVCPI